MDNKNQSAFIDWLETQIRAGQAEAAALELDHRRDEAVFSKIRGNVFDIFRSVYSASPDTAFFLARLEQIPASWQTALEQARRHDDSGKAHIETIKLEAAAQIRQAFRSTQEEHA